MRIEIKYFIASIFVGLCAVLYQTVSYKDFRSNIFKKSENNNNSMLQNVDMSPKFQKALIDRNVRESRMNQLVSETEQIPELFIPVNFVTFDQPEEYTSDQKKNLKTGVLQDVSVNKGLLDNRSATAPFPSGLYNNHDQAYSDSGYADYGQSYPEYFGYYPSYGSQGSAQKPSGSSMVGQSSNPTNSSATFTKSLSDNSEIEPVKGRLIGAGPKALTKHSIKPSISTVGRAGKINSNPANSEQIVPVQPEDQSSKSSTLKAAVAQAGGFALPWFLNYLKNKFWDKKIETPHLPDPVLDPIDETLDTQEPVQNPPDDSYVPMDGYTFPYLFPSEPDFDPKKPDNPTQDKPQAAVQTGPPVAFVHQQPAVNLKEPAKPAKDLPQKPRVPRVKNNPEPVGLQPSVPRRGLVNYLPDVPVTISQNPRTELPTLPDTEQSARYHVLPAPKDSGALTLLKPQENPALPLPAQQPSTLIPASWVKGLFYATKFAGYTIPIATFGYAAHQTNQDQIAANTLEVAGMQAVSNFNPKIEPTLVTGSQSASTIPASWSAGLSAQATKALQSAMKGSIRP